MKIPFGTIQITSASKKLIKEILDSNRVSSGRYVREFENKFAHLIGTKEAVCVSSGTDADALALAVLYDLGAKRGDEIIIPALSFVATGNAILQAGFTPVFVDVERKTLNINLSLIEQAITKKTKAIMPVHLMGKPVKMDEINRIAKKHKLLVISDAAEAHGAIYKNKNVGAWGDMTAYSLYVAHIISSIEGGVITTNNTVFASILRSLRSHGRACCCASCLLNTSSNYCAKRFTKHSKEDIRFQFDRIGFSSKMNELEAAIGLGNLINFEAILRKRRKNLYYLINELMAFSPLLTSIKKEPDEEIGPHAFPVVLAPNAHFSRNEIMDYLSGHGIDSRTLFSSMPTQCAGFRFLGYQEGDFPEAEYIGKNGFHIGIHQDIGKKECDYFLKLLKNFISKKNHL